MYRIFYAERDTTLYEKYPKQNSGIDQILELIKIASGSKLKGIVQTNQYNTRFLIDFGSQITTLSSSIDAGNIPKVANHAKSASIYLNLRASDASDLLQSYTIKAFPISESWTNGNGNLADIPEQRYGASWYYRTSDDIEDYWNTGSAHSANTSAGTSKVDGGGTWITGSGYEASQSFSNESPDIRMNITDIVDKWLTNDITNNGLIIKRPYSDEISGEVLGNLKFFGRESHTIFVPRLEVAWDDVTNVGSSSVTEINSDTYIPYIKNIKSEYRMSEIVKFRIGVRPEFPTKTFQTSSFYLTANRLPTSSYYSIIDSVTNETIIPFNTTASKIDCDNNGSFMKLRMDSFMPERYYKIMLKIIRATGSFDDTQTYDDFYFKVVN
ncbi:MAG: hypothetical protein H8E55_47645 [Pelagibacterales bacterium]|nr:hypothetical protein [Pelagibacterales bacterium]